MEVVKPNKTLLSTRRMLILILVFRWSLFFRDYKNYK